jgi:hypothetical protein
MVNNCRVEWIHQILPMKERDVKIEEGKAVRDDGWIYVTEKREHPPIRRSEIGLAGVHRLKLEVFIYSVGVYSMKRLSTYSFVTA